MYKQNVCTPYSCLMFFFFFFFRKTLVTYACSWVRRFSPLTVCHAAVMCFFSNTPQLFGCWPQITTSWLSPKHSLFKAQLSVDIGLIHCKTQDASIWKQANTVALTCYGTEVHINTCSWFVFFSPWINVYHVINYYYYYYYYYFFTKGQQ